MSQLKLTDKNWQHLSKMLLFVWYVIVCLVPQVTKMDTTKTRGYCVSISINLFKNSIGLEVKQTERLFGAISQQYCKVLPVQRCCSVTTAIYQQHHVVHQPTQGQL